MPHINPITGAIAGYRRDWFDETRTVEQECNTLQPGCVVALSDGTIVYPAPSNEVRGGGEVWALLTLDLVVLTSTGLTLPGAGLPDLGAMSWDGAVPIKDVRNSYGPWHVHERDGSQWLLSNGDAYDIQLLGSQLAIWRESPSSALPRARWPYRRREPARVLPGRGVRERDHHRHVGARPGGRGHPLAHVHAG